MGSGKGTTTQSSTQTPAAMGEYQSLLGQLNQVNSQPYQAYGGELVAPTNQTENTAYSQLEGAYGSAQPYINAASQYAALGAAPIQASAIANYSNPYQNMVTNSTMNELQSTEQANNAQAEGSTLNSGGLFNDREGVMQGQLANQESLANAQTLGGLNSQNYTQALGAAQADRSAAGQAAYTFGNLGQENLSTLLQGAQGTLSAGQLQQQQQQAVDTSNYQQWQTAQAFPYQELSWAAGLGTGIGSQMGGTTTGQTTPPPPSIYSQLGGLGALGLGAYFGMPSGTPSDRRIKTDVREIGKTNDGQPIYRFKYKGDHEWRIGLMAQEVEKDHPDAVGSFGDLKTVDIKRATDDAAHGKRGFASGGTPYGDNGGGSFGLGPTPYSGVQGYIPQSGGMGGGAWQGPKLPSLSGSGNSSSSNPLKSMSDMFNAGEKGGKAIGQFSNSSLGDSMSDAEDDIADGSFFKHGGVVRGFADGGVPDDDLEGGFDPDADAFSPNAGMDAPISFMPATRFGSDDDDRSLRGPGAHSLGDIGPGTDHPDFTFNPTRTDANKIYPDSEDVPLPPRRGQETIHYPPEPVEPEPGGPAAPLPPATQVADITGGAGSRSRGLGDIRVPEQKEEKSNALRNAFLTAGFGMLASRSPYFGVGLGEGGLQGLAAYSGTQKQERTEKLDQQKIDMQLKRLAEAKDKADRELELRTRAQNETERYHDLELTKPMVIDKDAAGQPIYGRRNDKGEVFTMDGSPYTPEARAKAAEQDNVAGEDYIKTLPPQDQAQVRQAGQYMGAVPSVNARSADAQRLRREIFQAYPDIDERMYGAQAGAVRKFWSGPDSDTIKSFNVSIAHLDTLQKAATALQNGNMGVFNQLKNYYERQTGQPMPTDFNAVRDIVADEIVKSIVGARAGVTEREEAHKRIAAEFSQGQFDSVINRYKELMTGQLMGLRQKFTGTTGMQPEVFDRFLMPETKQQLLAHQQSPSGAAPAGGAAANPPPATAAPPPAKPKQLSKNDEVAINWAKAHPDDPRAKEIMKLHGVQ